MAEAVKTRAEQKVLMWEKEIFTIDTVSPNICCLKTNMVSALVEFTVYWGLNNSNKCKITSPLEHLTHAIKKCA